MNNFEEVEYLKGSERPQIQHTSTEEPDSETQNEIENPLISVSSKRSSEYHSMSSSRLYELNHKKIY